MAGNIERDLLQLNPTLYYSCTKLNKVFSERSYAVKKSGFFEFACKFSMGRETELDEFVGSDGVFKETCL